MRQLCWSAVLLLVAMGSLGLSQEVQAQNARLEKGEVIIASHKVKGSEIPKVVVTGLFNAPPEKVWAIIDKCADYKKTMQRVEMSKEISRKGNKVRCEVEIDLPWPLDNLKAITEATHTVKPGELYKRAWNLVSGDYDFNKGSWVLRPYGNDKNRTLAVYTIHVKPKTAIPDSIKAKAQKSSLPDLFKHIGKQVE